MYLYHDKMYVNGYNLYIYIHIYIYVYRHDFFQALRIRIGEAYVAPRALVVSPSGWTVPFGDA